MPGRVLGHPKDGSGLFRGVEELNKDYFGYANQVIKILLNHLYTNWCKVMTKESNGGLLSSVGPHNYPHYHLRRLTQQTTEEVKDHQRHHLGGSQNAPLHWTNVINNVQEQLLETETT
jgi:hypothetical protein